MLDQLPDKVECVLRCSLSGWQKHIYHSVQVCVNIYMYMYDSVCISQITITYTQTKSIHSRDPGNNSGFNNAMMQLRKICNHPYLFLNEWYADDDLIRYVEYCIVCSLCLPLWTTYMTYSRVYIFMFTCIHVWKCICAYVSCFNIHTYFLVTLGLLESSNYWIECSPN